MDYRDRVYFWSTLLRALETPLALIGCFQGAGCPFIPIHSCPWLVVQLYLLA